MRPNSTHTRHNRYVENWEKKNQTKLFTVAKSRLSQSSWPCLLILVLIAACRNITYGEEIVIDKEEAISRTRQSHSLNNLITYKDSYDKRPNLLRILFHVNPVSVQLLCIFTVPINRLLYPEASQTYKLASSHEAFLYL